MPASSICSIVVFWVWMLWTVKRLGMCILRAKGGMSPVIQSLQWIRSGCSSGMVWLMTSRWNARLMRLERSGSAE